MASAAELAILISAKDQASSTLANVGKSVDDVGDKAGKTAGPLGSMQSALGGVGKIAGGFVVAQGLMQLPGLLIAGAQGAADDQAAMDGLKKAVENTGSSYDNYGTKIDAAIKKGQELAFTDGETAKALDTLISLTGSTEEGMARLATAQDLARGAGISLEQAAKLIGKTSDENTESLGRLGIQLGENATAQDVLNAVDAKFEGRAGTFAESDAGKMAKAGQQMGELSETIGAVLLPVMVGLASFVGETLVPAISGIVEAAQPVIDFIGDNLVPIMIGVSAAIMTVVVPALYAWAFTAETAVVPALIATVTAAAPLILTAAAIGIAVAALYVAWQSNFLGIQDITKSVIDFITPYITSAIDAIKVVFETVWPIIATIATTYLKILKTEVEIAIAVVRTVFETVFPIIRGIVETVFPIIATVVTTYIGIVRAEVEAGIAAVKWTFDNVLVPIQGIVSDVFSTIANIVTTIWGPTVTAIGTGVDTAKTAFDTTFVPIQGVVKDVFDTISGLVDTLWNGATGAVSKIGDGLATAKGFFADVYTTFKGYGEDIMQGLIDGVSGLYNTLKGWFDKISDLMKIDVPGFSPPYHAGYEQGFQFASGVADGMHAGLPYVQDAAGSVGGTMALPGITDGSAWWNGSTVPPLPPPQMIGNTNPWTANIHGGGSVGVSGPSPAAWSKGGKLLPGVLGLTDKLGNALPMGAGTGTVSIPAMLVVQASDLAEQTGAAMVAELRLNPAPGGS